MKNEFLLHGCLAMYGLEKLFTASSIINDSKIDLCITPPRFDALLLHGPVSRKLIEVVILIDAMTHGHGDDANPLSDPGALCSG